MSITKIKEFLIHFHSFRNIDLINQGIYQVRTKIYYSKDLQAQNINNKDNKEKKMDNFKVSYALPYNCTICNDKIEHSKDKDSETIKTHNVYNGFISEVFPTYITKTFIIKYSDEEIELDEFCFFKFETDLQVKTYFIDFELFFYDNFQNVNFKNKQSIEVFNRIEMKKVQTITITINEESSFQESFIPVQFTDIYSSVLNANIILLNLDYKIRKNGLFVYKIEGTLENRTEIDKEKDKSKIENEKEKGKENDNKNGEKDDFYKNEINKTNHQIEELLNLLDEKEGESSKIEEKVLKFKCHNDLLSFFISNDQNSKLNLIYKIETNTLQPHYVDTLYDIYVISLMNCYSILRTKYVQFIDTVLFDKSKNQEKESEDNTNSVNIDDSSSSEYDEETITSNSKNKNSDEYQYFSSLPQFIYYTEETDLEFPLIKENFNYNENKTLLRRFSKRLKTLDADYVLGRILLEISMINSQLSYIWYKYFEIVNRYHNEYNYIQEKIFWTSYMNEIAKYKKSQLVSVSEEENFVFCTDSNQLSINTELSEKIRLQMNKMYIKNNIDIPGISHIPEQFPIILEETYTKKNLFKGKINDLRNNSVLNINKINKGKVIFI